MREIRRPKGLGELNLAVEDRVWREEGVGGEKTKYWKRVMNFPCARAVNW